MDKQLFLSLLSKAIPGVTKIKVLSDLDANVVDNTADYMESFKGDYLTVFSTLGSGFRVKEDFQQYCWQYQHIEKIIIIPKRLRRKNGI